MLGNDRDAKIIVHMTDQFGHVVAHVVQGLVQGFVVLHGTSIGHDYTQEHVFVRHVFDADVMVEMSQIEFAG